MDVSDFGGPCSPRLVSARCFCIALAWIQAAAGHAQETQQTNPKKVIVRPQSFQYASDAPLSSRTLVQRPPQLKGLTGWTIETQRHRGWMYAAVPSRDGQSLATGGLDGTIRIWDVSSGRLLKAFVGNNSYIFHLAWSSDGRYLAAAGALDSTASIWETASGRLIATFKHPAHVLRVAWSPDDRRLLLAGGSSGSLRLWNTESGMQAAELDMGQTVQTVAWSPTGETIAVGVQGQATHLLDAESLRTANSLGEASTSPRNVAWSKDGKRLAVATLKGTSIWEVKSPKLTVSLPPGNVVAWSPDGESLASAPPSGTVQLWNSATGQALDKLPVGASELHWSSDGRTIFAAASETVMVWDLENKKAQTSFKAAGSLPQIRWLGEDKPICTGIGSPTISFFQPDGNPLREFRGHVAAVTCVALSPNGKTLATGSADTMIRLWDMASGKVLNTLNSHKASVTALAWSVNGTMLASGCADKIVRVWDSGGRLLHKLEGHSDTTNGLAWSVRTLASASADSRVMLWNPTTGVKTREFAVGGGAQSLAWTRDGKYLAVGDGDSKVVIWKVDNGTIMSRLEKPGSPRGISALDWAPGSPLLLTGRANHTLQLWDVRTGKTVRDFQAIAPVQAVAWLADEKSIVASGTDRCLRFWETATGRPRATIVSEINGIAVVSADGNYRTSPNVESELVFVARNEQGQTSYSPAEFAEKFKWTNDADFQTW